MSTSIQDRYNAAVAEFRSRSESAAADASSGAYSVARGGDGRVVSESVNYQQAAQDGGAAYQATATLNARTGELAVAQERMTLVGQGRALGDGSLTVQTANSHSTTTYHISQQASRQNGVESSSTLRTYADGSSVEKLSMSRQQGGSKTSLNMTVAKDPQGRQVDAKYSQDVMSSRRNADGSVSHSSVSRSMSQAEFAANVSSLSQSLSRESSAGVSLSGSQANMGGRSVAAGFDVGGGASVQQGTSMSSSQGSSHSAEGLKKNLGGIGIDVGSGASVQQGTSMSSSQGSSHNAEGLKKNLGGTGIDVGSGASEQQGTSMSSSQGASHVAEGLQKTMGDSAVSLGGRSDNVAQQDFGAHVRNQGYKSINDAITESARTSQASGVSVGQGVSETSSRSKAQGHSHAEGGVSTSLSDKQQAASSRDATAEQTRAASKQREVTSQEMSR